MEKQYLGDGVYVVVEGDMLKLTSENGIEVLDRIYLEPQVMEALVDYYQRAVDQQLVSFVVPQD